MRTISHIARWSGPADADAITAGRMTRQRGYTLAELLLVVGVLLVIGGLVFPPVMRMMADQPLKESAERTRSQLANVRIKALDSSVAWQFRFEPGGRRYLWMPLERTTLATGTQSTSGAPSNSTAVSATPQVGELPKGVTFSNDIDGITIAAERLDQEILSGVKNSYELQQVGWSLPVVFQPDGSTEDSQVAVVDAHNRQIRLNVRGVTGGITVTSIETRRRT